MSLLFVNSDDVVRTWNDICMFLSQIFFKIINVCVFASLFLMFFRRNSELIYSILKWYVNLFLRIVVLCVNKGDFFLITDLCNFFFYFLGTAFFLFLSISFMSWLHIDLSYLIRIFVHLIVTWSLLISVRIIFFSLFTIFISSLL